jgi:hypothetical protein
MSRWPRIAHNLVENSIEAMYCAIELHNKPILKYRYETCTILIINAWELLLKAYLYSIEKDKNIIKYLKQSLKEQQKTLDTRINDNSVELKAWFNALVDRIFTWKENRVILENLKYINKLRNDFIHAYIEELNPILFGLICKNIIEYQNFIKKFFKKDLSKHSNLVLLPIWFSAPVNIVDYLSSWANIRTSKIVKEIFDITKRLEANDITDSILVNFHISMNTANKVSNPDLLVSIGDVWETINKVTKYKFDPTWQGIWNIPVSELEKIFTIPYKSIKKKIIENGYTINAIIYNPIYRKYKDNEYHGVYWWRHPSTMAIKFSNDGLEKIIEEYRLALDTK